MAVDDKVDRLEFSQIVQGKANHGDLQKLLAQLLSAKSFGDLHRSSNVREIMDSCSRGAMSEMDLTTGGRSRRHSSMTELRTEFDVDIPD